MTVEHPAAFFTGFNEAGVAQDRHMFGDGGRGESDKFDELADADFAAFESHEEADSGFIGEGFGDIHKRVHVGLHFVT
jgi:hypothetical protein